MPRGEKLAVKVFACLAGAGLVDLVASGRRRWASNNDLGLRAILPAEVVLIVVTAAAMAGLQERAVCVRRSSRPRSPGSRSACRTSSKPCATTLSPQTSRRTPKYSRRRPNLWAAVRQHAAPGARVANNPLFPRRPHTVAGEYILGVARRPLIVFCRPRNGDCVCAAAARAPCAKSTRSFVRVFDGQGTPNDVHDLATTIRM